MIAHTEARKRLTEWLGSVSCRPGVDPSMPRMSMAQGAINFAIYTGIISQREGDALYLDFYFGRLHKTRGKDAAQQVGDSEVPATESL